MNAQRGFLGRHLGVVVLGTIVAAAVLGGIAGMVRYFIEDDSLLEGFLLGAGGLGGLVAIVVAVYWVGNGFRLRERETRDSN